MPRYHIVARPRGQPTPRLYACRRYHSHHGGRLVPIRRQGLTWTTRRGAEAWLEQERLSWPESPVYGPMDYEIVADDGGSEGDGDGVVRYTFADAAGQPVPLEAGTAAEAKDLARTHRLLVRVHEYRLVGETLIADFTRPDDGPEEPRP